MGSARYAEPEVQFDIMCVVKNASELIHPLHVTIYSKGYPISKFVHSILECQASTIEVGYTAICDPKKRKLEPGENRTFILRIGNPSQDDAGIFKCLVATGLGSFFVTMSEDYILKFSG